MQTVPIETSTSGAPRLGLFQAALGLWVFGSVCVCLKLLRNLRKQQVLRRQALPAPEHLIEEVRRVAAALRTRAVGVVLVPHIASPYIWCAGRLRLLWPQGWAGQQQVARCQGVIAHELAHVRRRDHLVAWLELAAGAVWWWNPLFWLARRRLRESAEMACDALALSILPQDRFAYAEVLLELSAGKNRAEPAALLGISSTGSRQAFERRFSMILSDRVSSTITHGGLAALAALALLALPHWSLGQAAAPKEEPLPKPPSLPAPSLPAPPKLPEPALAGETEPGGKAESALEARLQKIEATLKLIAHRLDANEPRPMPPAAEVVRLSLKNRNCVILLDQGRAQVVATDPDSGKTFWQSDLPGLPKPIERVEWQLESKGDANIEVRAKSPTQAVTYTLDAATGKQLQITRAGGPSDYASSASKASGTGVPVPVPPSASTRTWATTRTPMTAQAGNVPYPSDSPANSFAPRQVAATGHLDLVALATAYVDALGNLKLAQSRQEQMKNIPSGTIPSSEVDTAAINAETAQRKVNLLKAVAQTAYESAKAESQQAEQEFRAGEGSQRQLLAAQSTLKLLESILGAAAASDQRPSSDPSATPGASPAGPRR
jgi:beta-lactamase regulating signal transducer with metallopeptidase domain